jgi:hypothetical protein
MDSFTNMIQSKMLTNIKSILIWDLLSSERGKKTLWTLDSFISIRLNLKYWKFIGKTTLVGKPSYLLGT